MSVSVVMPQLGESVTEGTVTRWLKKEGEHVTADEALLEISTDNIDTEVPSPATGILRGVAVDEDETVAVGAQLAVIDDSIPVPPPISSLTPSAPWPPTAQSASGPRPAPRPSAPVGGAASGPRPSDVFSEAYNDFLRPGRGLRPAVPAGGAVNGPRPAVPAGGAVRGPRPAAGTGARGHRPPERAWLAFPEPPALGAQDPDSRPVLGNLPDDWHKAPDTVLDGADLDGLSVRGASLRGAAHKDKGVTRQDSMEISRVRLDEFEAILGCVAASEDGGRLAPLATEQACLLTRDEVQSRLRDLCTAESPEALAEVCQDLVESLAGRLARRAGFLKVPASELSATVAAVLVVTRGGARSSRWIGFAVGDCSIMQVHDDGFILGLDRAASALPTSMGRLRAGIGDLAPGDVLIAQTHHSLAENEQVVAQFEAWWGAGLVPSLPEFAWQLSFRAQGVDDDRTAACFWAR